MSIDAFEERVESIASTVRRRVLASGDRIWRTEEFEGSRDAVQAELRRLVRAGELERLRRGVYWRGRKTRFGMTAADQVRALSEVLGKQATIGAAGWYAASLLGLSTQVSPRRVLAMTARPPAGFNYLQMIDRSQRIGRHDARLSSLEVTMLEAIEGWEKYVEAKPERAVGRFLEMIGDGSVRVAKLVAAAKTEPAVVRERLKWLLIQSGRDADAERIEGARSDSARRRALSVFPRAKEGAALSLS
jgi:Transcriptional regulator, AbiEi antitoxin